MKRKVLIVGAGQLGSRYLQGLARVTKPLEILVFDHSENSLSRAQQRWSEMEQAAEHRVNYITSLSALPNVLDLAVIATTADSRAALVTEINQLATISYWVLEKVLAQSAEEVVQLQNSLHSSRATWVNTPMYLWSLYRNIRSQYPLGISINARFEGFNGLACNSMHYVDFVGRWNVADVIEVDTSGLKSEWYPSKRDGFYEIDGEIRFSFADGSKLKVASKHEKLDYTAQIIMGSDIWDVSESEGIARCSDGRTIYGSTPFQSQLTAPMVEAIFSGLPCGLPTLAQSSQHHTLFINAMLEHWNRHMQNNLNRLPIT